jgi:hypothetical protein
VLWYILWKKVWEPIQPQYRVLIGMVVFFITGLNLPPHLTPPMLAFTTVPAGWYAINRLMFWLVPALRGFSIMRFDAFIVFGLFWFMFILPIKFLCSMLIGPIAVLYILYLLIRDFIKVINGKRLEARIRKHVWDEEKPRLYRVK